MSISRDLGNGKEPWICKNVYFEKKVTENMSMKQQYDQCVAWIIPYTLQQNGFLA